jgi:hypothetical protein
MTVYEFLSIISSFISVVIAFVAVLLTRKTILERPRENSWTLIFNTDF